MVSRKSWRVGLAAALLGALSACGSGGDGTSA